MADLNPFGTINFGGMSTYATIGLVIAVALVLAVIIGVFIYIYFVKKAYNINIHCFKLIGNVPTRVAIYSAKEVPFGLAGDRLWRVAGAGWNKIKTIKWLSVGKIQTAGREFWYWIRPDGEWENFCMVNIDEMQAKAGVKLVQEDMRLQRLATEKILEMRHMKKNFWEQYGTVVMTLIFFLIIAVSLVIIFFQYSKLIDKMNPMIDTLTKSLNIVQKSCPLYFNETTSGGEITTITPVS
jgi:hypothetical protein